ncbi:transporter substrate-binding domain-containing protein [Butyrivibrio proteoclasticus]|uniref:transporter substrate-binding domain-containing protein n=1 Tax=Butyrivibrio proteoclasticus TaxID=43305 RepID=UPI0018CC710F|nr:transporter substrate-binding domain-containing protein [Butyrivibrio proteoclasticus]
MKKSSKKALLIFMILILAVISFPSNSRAASKSKTVKVGYYNNEIFQEGASEGAEKKGYAYEYYRKLSEYTGWDYEYVYGSFKDIYQMLLDGKVDLVAGLAYTEERSTIIAYPDKAMGFETYGIVKHESDSSITADIRTLNGKSIGVLDSAIYNTLKKYLDDNRIDAKIIKYPSYDELLTDFDHKKIDLFASENDGTYARNHAEVLFVFGEVDYYLGVNIKRPDILEELNVAQSQLFSEEPNYTSSLRAKYYSESIYSRAFTDSEKEWIKDHTTLTVGYLDNYLPYSDTSKDGSVTGMVKDVVPAVFSTLKVNNIEISYVPYENYNEMMTAINNNEVDMAFPVGGGLFYSEEDGIYLSNAVLSSFPDLIYNKKYMGSSNSVFAINENNKMQYYYIKSHFPTATIATYPSIDDCLKAVVNGEAQFTTLNGLRTSDMLKNNGYDSLSFRQLTDVDDRCFGIKIGNEGLLKLVNRGINILGTKYVSNYAYNYTSDLYSYTILDMIKENIFGFIACIVIIIGFVIYFVIRYICSIKKKIEEKESEKKDLVDFYESKMLEDKEKEIDAVNFKGQRILIVEDNSTNQAITSKVLKKIGFEIQIAVSPQEAYEKIKAAPAGYFNVLLMDVNSPEFGGKEAARKIRSLSDPKKAEISIVALDAVL